MEYKVGDILIQKNFSPIAKLFFKVVEIIDDKYKIEYLYPKMFNGIIDDTIGLDHWEELPGEGSGIYELINNNQYNLIKWDGVPIFCNNGKKKIRKKHCKYNRL